MTEPTPTQLIRALLAKFLSWGRQQLRTSRGYAVPDLTRYGYGHGAGTTGMRIGLRPAPDGVALHTVTHCLYRVGQGVCPFTHSTAGPFVAWHVWVGGSYRSCVEQRAVESKKELKIIEIINFFDRFNVIMSFFAENDAERFRNFVEKSFLDVK